LAAAKRRPTPFGLSLFLKKAYPEPGIPSQPFSLRVLSQGFLATCESVRKKGFWPLDYGAIGLINKILVYLKFSDNSSQVSLWNIKQKGK
jgi:hypothetical protein